MGFLLYWERPFQTVGNPLITLVYELFYRVSSGSNHAMDKGISLICN